MPSFLNTRPGAKRVAPAPDITYRAVDGLFTCFYPESKSGEGAWRVINATEGGEGGKVLSPHAASVVDQLRAAGYIVAEAVPLEMSEAEEAALFAELANA
ncbi:hypothetical protein ACSFA0_24975 [Variovorax sp. LT1P1]|uniref:hypothetical protein n=1 Tax=Variovorax sp. LT1P1 TaxID=3443730 RepID=UPI003F4900E7